MAKKASNSNRSRPSRSSARRAGDPADVADQTIQEDNVSEGVGEVDETLPTEKDKKPVNSEFDTESPLGISLRGCETTPRDPSLYTPQFLKVGMLSAKQGRGLNKVLETCQRQNAFRVVGSPSGGGDSRKVKVENHADAIRWFLEQIDESASL